MFPNVAPTFHLSPLLRDHSRDLHQCHCVLKQHNKITNNIVQADGNSILYNSYSTDKKNIQFYVHTSWLLIDLLAYHLATVQIVSHSLNAPLVQEGHITSHTSTIVDGHCSTDGVDWIGSSFPP